MSFNNNTNPLATQEDCSKGGKSRAANLSPERRKEIAINASHSRSCMKGIPKAKHSGILHIGDIKISCAVLDNGKRVITQTSMNTTLGRKGKNASTHNPETALILPNFLSPDNLKQFIDSELGVLANPLVFLYKTSGKAYGFDATLLPKVCDVYLKAREMGVLLPSQKHIAERCEILVRALAQVGIIALVDECSGFQKEREKDELQKLFSAFIAKELQPWVSRFPSEFFCQLKRMYGLEQMKKNPPFFGHLINRWVYDEISEELRPQLKKLNPVTEKGHRKHCHHQFLTQNVGCPALEKQIMKVTTLMSVSDSKEDFEILLEKSKPKS